VEGKLERGAPKSDKAPLAQNASWRVGEKKEFSLLTKMTELVSIAAMLLAAVIAPAGRLSPLLVFAIVAPFTVFLTALKTQALLSIPSVATGAPRSESL